MGSVESYNVVALILDPDPTFEQARAGMGFRGDIENQAPHVAQEFTMHESEGVVGAVEPFINEDSWRRQIEANPV